MPRRVMILGLDGASLDLVEPWAQAGHLPALQNLMERGTYSQLRSVMPILSSAAWASFMTGMNPGKHGLYDFVQRDLHTYRRHVVDRTVIRGRSLWRLLGDAGHRVGVVNVPMTYPAEAVNGFLVTGLGTPDYRPFTYPAELADSLRLRNYQVNKAIHYVPGQEDAFLDEVYRVTDVQATAALDLAQTRPWDFFVFVVRDTDELAHFFWRFMDESHPGYDPAQATRYGNAILRYYQHVDRWIARFAEAAGLESDIVVLSDHGCGPLYRDVMLNEWLRRSGFLAVRQQMNGSSLLRQSLAQLGISRQRISAWLRSLQMGRVERWIKDALGDSIRILPESARPDLAEAVDWSQTQAYSFGYHGQIYINLQGREADGTVAPADYEATCARVIEALRMMVDPGDGKPVVTGVYRKEELFHGDALSWAPDITVIMRSLAYITRQGYEFAEQPGDLFSSPRTGESGSHREMGMLIASGPSFVDHGRLSSVPSLMDVAPTVLHLMASPVPPEMDGRVLVDWLTEAHRSRAVQSATETHTDLGESSALTAADEEAILEQLRNLGYVE